MIDSNKMRPLISAMLLSAIVLVLTACGGGGGGGGATPATLDALTLDPAAVPDGLLVGASQQFTARAVFSDNTSPDVTDDATWSSSDTGVVTVSSTGLVEAVGSGSARVSAEYEGETASTTILVSAPSLSKIEVTQPTDDPLLVGLKRQFTATGLYDDGSKRNVTANATWNSDDPTVLVFSTETKGLAIANSTGSGSDLGSADLTASLSGTTSAALTVSVKNPDDPITPEIPVTGRVEINPADLPPIPANLSIPLKAFFIETGGQATNVTDTATWTSSDTSIGTVTDKGVFTGLKAGTVTISAKEVAKDVTGQLEITVDATTVQSIAAEPETIPVLPLRVRFRVKFIATLQSGEKIDITGSMVFVSSDTDVVSVLKPEDEPGIAYLYGSSAGTANVSAVLPDTTVRFEQDVTVAVATLDSLRVSPSSPPELPVGLSTQFRAIGGYSITGVSGTQEFDITSQATFASSNEAFATISNAAGSFGLATAKAVGTTNITASVPSVITSNAAPLTVSSAQLQTLSTEPLGDVTIGLLARVLQFKVTGNYSDGTSKDITDKATFYSDDTSIAGFIHEDRPGLLQLEKTGRTALVIFATDRGLTATVAKVLDVTSASLNSVDITPPQGTDLATVPVGSTVQLTATGTFDDTSTADMTLGCSWGTSNPDLGTFSSTPGELTAKAAGTFDAICRVGAQQFTQSVTVVGGTGITTGTWEGTGTNTDGSTYAVCFNVSADRSKLTPNGSTCTDGASLEVVLGNLQGGTCTAINILHKDDVEILLQKTFFLEILNSVVRETVRGEFDTTTTASGTATRQQFNPLQNCNGEWSATPAP